MSDPDRGSCGCGWRGPWRKSDDDAQADVRDHCAATGCEDGTQADPRWLEAWDLPYACTHPIVVDEKLVPFDDYKHWRRECALCGFGYDRSSRILEPLRAQCLRAWSVDLGRIGRALDDEDALEVG